MDAGVRKTILAFLLLSAVMLSACVTVKDKQWSKTIGPEPPLGTHLGSQILIVEINDDGEFWDPQQFERLKQWLSTDGGPVVTFVHGWHHNAAPNDKNLAAFKEFLPGIEDHAKQRIRGIYVGWRGDEVNTVIPLPQPMGDFLTAKSRKKASISVGNGALKEIVDLLASYGESRNVVLIGHSFGASALYHASKKIVAKEAGLNDHMEIVLLNPALGMSEIEDRKNGRSAEPDLFDLQYADLVSDASRDSVASVSGELSNSGFPLDMRAHANRRLFVLQSSKDWVIKRLFKYTGYGSPIGFESRLLTHDACATKSALCSNALDEARLLRVDEDVFVSPDRCLYALADRQFIIRVRGGANADHCAEADSSRIWAVSGDRSVSANHNDVMNEIQRDALAALIAYRLSRPTKPLSP